MGQINHSDFRRAADDFAARPGSAEPIAGMMQIAFEAPSLVLRGWAAQWLRAHTNIALITNQIEGQDNAAPPPAKGIL